MAHVISMAMLGYGSASPNPSQAATIIRAHPYVQNICPYRSEVGCKYRLQSYRTQLTNILTIFKH